jgi:translation elongation factor EF-Tu-like GTPase
VSRLVVVDVFFIRGRGVVATGQVDSGTLSVGDQVQVNGGPGVRIDGIEKSRAVLDHAQAGDNVGLLFKDLDRDHIRTGDVITGAGEITAVINSPDATAVAAPVAGRDPQFARGEEQRRQFLSMRDAGLMTDDQVDESLRGLAFTVAGRRWAMGSGSEQWYSAIGEDYRPDTPPA